MITANEEQLAEVADFFAIFGDMTRTRILYELWQEGRCVGDLAKALRMSDSAVSHQLRVLRVNGLVRTERRGKKMMYALSDEHVAIILETGLTHLGERWQEGMEGASKEGEER